MSFDGFSENCKTLVRLGDFNVNFLNYDQNTSANEFLDCSSSHLFLSHILQTARVRHISNSKTLTDNVFSNATSPIIISGNLSLYLRSQ